MGFLSCLWLLSTLKRHSEKSASNEMAETIIGLFKTEVIWRSGPWKNIDEVEYATLEWVDWFNNRRLLEPIGDIPPAEFEQAYYDQLDGQAVAA
jgi:putative transposase